MKILIVKIAAIGDVVMSLPLLSAIRDAHPNAHITWIAGSQVASLLNATRQIDKLIEVDESSLYKGGLSGRLSAMGGIWRRIGGRSYDLCLTCHPDPRYRWISFPAFCKSRRALKRAKGRVNPVPGRYHGEEYVRLFSGNDGASRPPIRFPEIALPESRFQMNESAPIVAIAPGGAKNILADDALRRWPIESYAALAKKLSRPPLRLALTGSASDNWVKNHFNGTDTIDLIGKLDLLDFIAFLKKCSLFITHDSGPLHLAKLAGCPTIALFGPTMPSEKVGLGENIRVLWGGESLSCRPCYDGKTYAKCGNNLCLRFLSPEKVFETAGEILQLHTSFSC